MPTTAELLDLATGVGQRQATFRFELIDAASSRPLGNLAPVQSPPTLSSDTSRSVVRALNGLLLDRADTAAVDVLSDRLRIYMQIGGEEFPLGTYVFTDSHKLRTTYGRQGDYGVQDLGFVVAQLTEFSVAYGTNTNIGDAIADLLSTVSGLPDGFEVEATPAVLGSPVAWPAGTDRAQILADLAALGGYFGPYMGNDSVIRVRQAFDPAGEASAFTFAEGGRVIAGSISESDDLLEAPNAFIVVDNANTALPIVGRYDVPPSAPHSFANRGFTIAVTMDIQGVGTTTNAEVAARAFGLTHSIFERVTLSTPPDPRHDAYDVIDYDGSKWLETAWSMPLREGGEMSHTLQRAYDPNNPERVSEE